MEKISPKAVWTNVSASDRVSWVDRLVLWIDRLPMPAWLFYIALTIGGQILFNLAFWIDGSVPLWENVILPSVSFPLVILGLAFYHYLTKAGSKALQNFRPLLEADEDEIAKIDQALNYLPAWMNWIILIWAVLGSIPYVFYGSNTFGEIVPLTNLPLISIYFISALTVLPFLNQIIRIIRQVRIMQDLHRRASNINLLHLEPAHAFARLTAGAGGGLILLMVVGNLYNPELSTGVNLYGLLFMVFMGVVIFIAPLIGMRNRLVQEKVQRLKEISELLEWTITQIHDKVSNKDLEISEARSTMGALIEEKALIEKVSTWPWNPGTIRGFASTLILPILMWFVNRFLELNF